MTLLRSLVLLLGLLAAIGAAPAGLSSKSRGSASATMCSPFRG